MPGGVTVSLGSGSLKNGKMTRKIIEYEITIIDKEPKKPLLYGLFHKQLVVLFNNFLKGNSVSKSVLSQSHKQRLQPFKEKLNVTEEGYTVAYQSSNKAYNGMATFTSEMMAQSYMHDQLIKDPLLIKELHIIPNYELQET